MCEGGGVVLSVEVLNVTEGCVRLTVHFIVAA